MTKNGVKFYRLGLNSSSGVERSTYEKYTKVAGAMIFAKVNESAGTWDAESTTYEAPAYYIWANGLEYKVADADALKYALNHIGLNEQKLKEIDASIDRLDSSVQKILDSYVKSLSVESKSDYVVLEPADIDASTGDVAFSIGLNIADVSTVTAEGEGLADAYSVKKYVLAKVAEAGHLSYKVVDSLPEKGEENIIYLVPDEKSVEGDVYQEYMWINGKWELLGDTKIRLQDYYTKEETDEKLADLSTALTEYVDTQDASLKEYVDAADASLKEAIDAAVETFAEELEEEEEARKIADASLEAAIKAEQERAEAAEEALDASIKAEEERAEEKEAEIDASIDRLDASVNLLEEKVLTGVVNSLEVEDKVQSDYVGLAADTSRGNVTVTLSGNVVDASTAEYQGIANNGLATVGYVEERLDQYNWVIIEEDEEPEPAEDSAGNVTVNSTSTQPQLVSLSSVSDDAKSLSISSQNSEVTVTGK